MSRKCILILGGARSGKSHFAQDLASQMGKKVLFVATAPAMDEEMKQRIKNHQNNRPKSWRTLESLTGIGRKIEEHGREVQVVLIDCMTLLINNCFEKCNCGHDAEEFDEGLLNRIVKREVEELLECVDKLDVIFIIVSNEVGTGLVPISRLGRTYRDLLGNTNRELARHADQVYLMTAGIPMQIKPQP